MRRVLVLALAVLAAAPVVAGCASKKDAGQERPKEYDTELQLEIKDYRVVWTRGGRQGYVKTYDAREPEGPTVTLHKVLDNDFREMGWISNDGKGERYVYPPQKVGEALRTSFQREELPVDTIENQVRRCLGIEPTVQIALTAVSDADLKKQ